jgi:3-deoxy-7-phosphoheptulonate synthase
MTRRFAIYNRRSMEYFTDDLRIRGIKEVEAPKDIHDTIPITRKAALISLQARREIHRILTKQDDRLLVVIGPCSIHDPLAALDYARRLLEMKQRLQSVLIPVEF